MKYRRYYIPRKVNKEYQRACKVYVERHGIKIKKRDFDNVIQRQVIAYLMSNNDCGYYAIGDTLGIDHSTASYSVKKVKEYIEVKDAEVMNAVEEISKEVDEILNKKEEYMSKFKKGDRVVVIDSLLYQDCEVVDVIQLDTTTMYSIKTEFFDMKLPESQVYSKDDAKKIINDIRVKITYWECKLNELTDKLISNIKK